MIIQRLKEIDPMEWLIIVAIIGIGVAIVLPAFLCHH